MIESYENNGMLVAIWGNAGWKFLHSASFCYPLNNPTDVQKRDYKRFYELVGCILPCGLCRQSYQKFIVSGKTALTDAVMENRHTLTKWLYDLHNAVNDKLGIYYGVSYEDICIRYNAYKSKCNSKPDEKGCTTPLDIKGKSYLINSITDCPIIEIALATKFVRHARQRNLPDIDYYILAKFKEKNALDKCLKNKFEDDTWCRRNKECKEIIDHMRINGIPSIETDGPWKGYPTISELRLILRLSSNLPHDELAELIKKIHP